VHDKTHQLLDASAPVYYTSGISLNDLHSSVAVHTGALQMTTLFHHVSIPRPPGAQSAAQARDFYCGLLGLNEIAVPASLQHLDLVWFAVGSGELHLFSEEPRTDTSGRHFCLHVADQAAVRAHLETAHVTCTDTVAIPGRPRFFTHDPFGNSIEITTIEDASAYNKGV